MKNRCSQNRLLALSLALGLCVAMLPILIAQGHLARAASGMPSAPAAPPHTLIRSWGDNSSGQLGVGRNQGFSFPVTTHVLTNTVALATGNDYTLALRDDGTVLAWGMNEHGQLGLGYNSSHELAPHRVPGLSHVTAIAAGVGHSAAVTQRNPAGR